MASNNNKHLFSETPIEAIIKVSISLEKLKSNQIVLQTFSHHHSSMRNP